MHPAPNHCPARKKETDSEKEHADFGQKRILPFLRREKASFEKAEKGAHHKFQNDRQENEIPKLLPPGPTGKRCIFSKRLEEVVHNVFVNSLQLLARQTLPPHAPFYQPSNHRAVRMGPLHLPRPSQSPAPRELPWQPLIFLRKIIGPPGFEPGTSSTPRKRATRLRYGPYELEIVSQKRATLKTKAGLRCKGTGVRCKNKFSEPDGHLSTSLLPPAPFRDRNPFPFFLQTI